MAATCSRSGTALTASATFGLSISEKWIRERLNLEKDSLDDVRSLSLPGSYCEKITHLGRSLMGFSRLKHLDLSRNAVESLEGLQDLRHLESLNLYYNNIPSLKELFKLGHNSKLEDLDLRLNPVTKNEPDYRLFVVHLLVNLRKLDDRGVRDSERKAALMHFDSDQASEFDEYLRQQQQTPFEKEVSQPHRQVSARTALVKSLASRPTALDDDTDYLLDLISKNDQLLGAPSPHHPYQLSSPPRSRPPSQHPQQQQQQQHHDPSLSPPTPRYHVPHTSHIPTHTSPSHQRHHKQSHHKQSDHVTPSKRHQSKPKLKTRSSRQQFSPPTREYAISDGDADGSGFVRYPDQSKPGYTVQGNVTSAPPGPGRDCEESNHQARHSFRKLLVLMQDHVEGDLIRHLEQDVSFREKFNSWYTGRALDGDGVRGGEGRLESLQGEVEALQTELKSMEGHLREKDKGDAAKETRIKELQDLLTLVKSESAELGRQLQAQVMRAEELTKSHVTLEDSHRNLQQAKSDVSLLQQRTCSLQEENKSLREALKQGPSVSMLEKAHKQIGELQADNCALKREMEANSEKHKQDLLNNSQLQELATMLQEGHRSLVATNDHLLQELEETRQRHSREVTQMNVNYEQLRKTVQLYS